MSADTITFNNVTLPVEMVREALQRHDEAAKQQVFQVGDWVVDLTYGWGTMQVLPPFKFTTGLRAKSVTHGEGAFDVADVRPATPDEIAAATRIAPKVGMLLEDKEGVVWLVDTMSPHSRFVELAPLVPGRRNKTMHETDLSTTRYTIRDSVTIQGVR